MTTTSSRSHASNNFDFLRFVLASLVILSHAPQLIDGSTRREPLMWLTHGDLSLGALAVDGFFVISGYLITQSWLSSRGMGSYLKKRVLRIYPGFLVACVVSMGLADLLTAGSPRAFLQLLHPVQALHNMLILRCPEIANCYHGLHDAAVNGSMWTIAYEFNCYLLVAALGLAGLLHRRKVVAIVGGLALFAFALQGYHDWLPHVDLHWFGSPEYWPRFASFFLAGSCFYLYRDRVVFTRWGAAAALALSVLSLLFPRAENLILPTCGAYLLLYLAFLPTPSLHRFGRRGDFSYGIYLYGWPASMALVWLCHGKISPWALFLGSFLVALGCAVLSWRFVEAPTLALKEREISAPLRRLTAGAREIVTRTT